MRVAELCQNVLDVRHAHDLDGLDSLLQQLQVAICHTSHIVSFRYSTATETSPIRAQVPALTLGTGEQIAHDLLLLLVFGRALFLGLRCFRHIALSVLIRVSLMHSAKINMSIFIG